MFWVTAALLLSPAIQAGALPSPDPGGPSIEATHAPHRVPGGAPFVSLGGGALNTGYSFEGGGWMQLFATQQVEGRFLIGRFTLEGSLLHALPMSGSSDTRAYLAQLRLGWTGERFAIAAGPSFQLAPEATPSSQLLPTVRAEWILTDAGLGISGGLFDLYSQAPLRISLELPQIFGFGYVAPLGVEAHAAVPLGHEFELRAQGLALRVANATQAMVLLSAAFTGLEMGGAR
jgi:hypothetical protein